MRIIAGNSNLPLAEKISRYLGTPLTKADIGRFADNEISVDIKESIRGEDVFVIQSTGYPANDNLMELLITIDALKRGSAKTITAVIPYFGYARQDRKSGPRTPISAKLVSNLISVAGTDRVVTLDLHATQIQGFFDIPVDNLFCNTIFVKYIQENMSNKDLIIVSPDVGGVLRARSIAKWLDCDLAIVDKRRPMAGTSEVMNIIGDVKDKVCILIDDIVDSAGTLCNAANKLKEMGANSVYACVTHGIFSSDAMEKISNSALSKIICTDSILNQKVSTCSKIEYVTVADLLGESINRIITKKSLSSLFLTR